MRILTLSNCPLVDTQGSGYVILGYARELSRRGHSVDLIGPRQLQLPRGGPRAIRYRQMLGMAVTTIRKAAHYDVLEFYGGEAWLAIELLRRRRRRPLLVAHSNGLEPLATRRLVVAGGPKLSYRLDLSRLYARGFRQVDALVTVSDFDHAFALAEGYQEPQRVLTIENPLLASYLSQPLSQDRPPTLLYCGSWIPRKGVETLAEATSRFLATHPTWRLVLAGAGADFRAADYFADEIAAQVEVVGPLGREDGLRLLYQRCRIAIQASVYESFGLAAAEAMACGCALVATPVGFAAALQDQCEVLHVPVGDAVCLQAALSRLASDDNLRRRLAQGGLLRVQRLDWQTAGQRLERAYTEWIEEHSRRMENMPRSRSLTRLKGG